MMPSMANHSQAVAPKKRSAELHDHEHIELEDRLVAQRFIQRVQMKLEKKDLAQLKDDQTKTNSLLNGSEKADLRPLKASSTVNGDYSMDKLPVPREDDLMKPNSLLSDQTKPDLRPSKAATTVNGDHKMDMLPVPVNHSHSITDESSGPIFEGGDPLVDSTDFSFTNWVAPPKEVGMDPLEKFIRRNGSEGDDFYGANGEIDVSSEHFIELSGHKLLPNGAHKRDEGNEEEVEVEENGEVIQASQGVQDEQQQPTKAKLETLNGRHHSEKSGAENFSTNGHCMEVKKMDSFDSELEDTASNLGTISSEAREDANESVQKPRPDSENTLLYPQPLEPEDVINPFSLEVRIRQAREQQDIISELEAETSAENLAGISQPQLNLEEASFSTVSTDEPTGSSERAVENGYLSQVKERVRTEATTNGDCEEDAKELSTNKTGVGEAVLLGALASGVNGPTWVFIRIVLVGLVASLFMLLQVAIKSGSWFLLLNVLFLITLAAVLILLLRWYISQIGLVSVDKQMAELNLTSEPNKVESKTL